MTRLSELIEELCPNGVERKALGEIGVVVRGKRFVKEDMAESGIACIHYGEIYTTYGISATESVSFVSEERARSLRFAQPGDVIIASAGETVEDIGKAVAWLGDGPIAIHDACYAFSSDMDAEFVSHFLASRLFRDQIKQQISSSKISSISTRDIAKAKIPVPPLEVQREIVRILNEFSQLETELATTLMAELEGRRRQFEHYRSVMLASSDDSGSQLVSLGDLIRLNFGTRITKAKDSGTNFPVYGGGGESFRTDAYNREDEWVVSRFAMSANCVRRVRGKFWMLDSGFTLEIIGDAVDKDFLGQLLLSMQPMIFATSTQAAQKNIDVRGFKRLHIRIPSLAVQKRVARELNRFDALTNDLGIGLPTEAEARRKQYEYYRDELLAVEGSQHE